ncbi:MAG: phosphoribosylaminoimidazolesuccinocarboxamide synthase [Candidatus Coproplasma sp.]
MEKKEQLYEGKAKKVYATENPDYVIVSYKDDATAFNGQKKGTIVGKGVINNKMSNYMMQMLEKKGIPTHFVEQLSDRETVVKKVKIVPLEVIIRNVAAGSFSKRYGVPEGTKLAEPTIEFSYKCDELNDPLINTYHVFALNLATKEEVATITKMAFAINEAMKEFFKELKIDLIDFKLEFGRFHDQIVLADEISPDTCRFWEADTWDTTKHVSLDKDRFRRDLGGVEDAYAEIFKRLGIK